MVFYVILQLKNKIEIMIWDISIIEYHKKKINASYVRMQKLFLSSSRT